MKKNPHAKNERAAKLKALGLAVKRSSAGLGLFATRPFRKNEFIIEYTGEHISHDQADRRGGLYLFTLNEHIVIDGKGHENIARYFNHSCEPNIEALIEDDTAVIFQAITDIVPGDELTFDYGKEYTEDIIAAKGCRCRVCHKHVSTH